MPRCSVYSRPWRSRSRLRACTGVLRYSVIQRKREIGIRIPIGATSSDMLRLIVGQALGVAGIGVAVGLVGAFALTRVIRALLFNTDPLDGLTFAASAGVLLLIAALSSYLPARVRFSAWIPPSRCGRSR